MKKNLEEQIRELEEQMEALVIAIPKEEAAYFFYLKLSDTSRHEGSRKMFIQLAQQELDHKKNLETLVKEIQRELDRLKAEKAKG